MRKDETAAPLSEQQLMERFYAEQSVRTKQDKLERFKRLNRYAAPGQVLFVGSSLMEQFPIHELAQGLGLSCKIYNRGVGGFTTQELLQAMDVCVYELRPAHVFINIGTNDLNGPDYRQEDLIDRYAQILRGIRDHLPEAKLYLLAYYPVCPEVGDRLPYMRELLRHRTNERIQAANEAVRALAGRFGAEFLDLNGPLYDEQGQLKAEYTVEGMHMYADGYVPILQQLLPLLKTLP